uniref:Uncharacterized protein n=1 Tax=Noctiluca scintillans TaxID=2966 RepID=A0A7S1B145_NOCSC|mmetsp:Transcript_7660/g.20889  ORF Transcript_7660/g.20889 Transcript_7660/m.20889 type:complete len:475 (+) Transcript_7660:36-1460(+)
MQPLVAPGRILNHRAASPARPLNASKSHGTVQFQPNRPQAGLSSWSRHGAQSALNLSDNLNDLGSVVTPIFPRQGRTTARRSSIADLSSPHKISTAQRVSSPMTGSPHRRPSRTDLLSPCQRGGSPFARFPASLSSPGAAILQQQQQMVQTQQHPHWVLSSPSQRAASPHGSRVHLVSSLSSVGACRASSPYQNVSDGWSQRSTVGTSTALPNGRLSQWKTGRTSEGTHQACGQPINMTLAAPGPERRLPMASRPADELRIAADSEETDDQAIHRPVRALAQHVAHDDTSAREQHAKLSAELAESLAKEAELEPIVTSKRSQAVLNGLWINTLKRRVEEARSRGAESLAPKPNVDVVTRSTSSQSALTPHSSRVRTETDMQRQCQNDFGDEAEEHREESNNVTLESVAVQLLSMQDLETQVACLEDELTSRKKEMERLQGELRSLDLLSAQHRNPSLRLSDELCAVGSPSRCRV